MAPATARRSLRQAARRAGCPTRMAQRVGQLQAASRPGTQPRARSHPEASPHVDNGVDGGPLDGHHLLARQAVLLGGRHGRPWRSAGRHHRRWALWVLCAPALLVNSQCSRCASGQTTGRPARGPLGVAPVAPSGRRLSAAAPGLLAAGCSRRSCDEVGCNHLKRHNLRIASLAIQWEQWARQRGSHDGVGSG